MLKPSVDKTWLGWVVFFFAWGFVIHGVGLVLHELGGHALAMKLVACGFERLDLTYFGHGSVQSIRCPPPLYLRTFAITDSAGIVVTAGAGAVALALQRRAGLTPLMRLLLALLATHFLIGQLWYATAGGYHVVRDPAPAAIMLEMRGLHVLAWLPSLVLYAAASLYGAHAIVGAFHACFGSCTRVHALKQIAATIGVAGVLYLAAQRIEAAIHPADFPSITAAAEQRAAAQAKSVLFPAHLFPIRYVLVAIAVAAFALALARPVAPSDARQEAALPPVPRRYAVGVAAAALVCAGMITLLNRV
jgi:hypothetical protein